MTSPDFLQTDTRKNRMAIMDDLVGNVLTSIHMDSPHALKQAELRGNNLLVQTLQDKEVVLVGAAGTGKSVANLIKLDTLAKQYAGIRALIVRKTRAHLYNSTLVTFEKFVLGERNPMVTGVQRKYRSSYHYPNGSEIVIGGMNDPESVLSSEYDIIIAAETSQFELNDWEYLFMRLRSGILPYRQILGDTNPDKPNHWIKQRADEGRLTLLNTYHQDNPAYWDNNTNDWTDAGRDYVLETLNNLTGIRRSRYLLGEWVLAEGMVYDQFNNKKHVIPYFDPPSNWRRIRSIDFGYTNPFSCSWWAIDDNGVMYQYRQIYMSHRLVVEHAEIINELSKGERIEVTVADHDAEGRATLDKAGIPTIPAKKDIIDGIQRVQRRLQYGETHNPTIYFMENNLVEVDPELVKNKMPLCTIDEFYSYIWHTLPNGKANKELPIDSYNHGLDEARYAVAYEDERQGGGSILRAKVRGLNVTKTASDRKNIKVY